MVDYNNDIIGKYELLFQAAYEKANIWPISDSAEAGLGILQEEIEEAANAVIALDDYVYKQKTALNVTETKAFAVNAICELLQVIAVCNKYEEVFGRE